MKKDAFRQLLKKGPVKALRMTEKEFDENFMEALDITMDIDINKLGWEIPNESEVVELIEGVFKGWIGVKDAELLVIRMNGGKGFVFIVSPEEFVDFVKKYYGSIKSLINLFK